LREIPVPLGGPPLEEGTVSCTILLIDSDDTRAQKHQQPLRGAGYRVIRVSSGDEARVAFVQDPPALVLLDASLDDGHGAELCREMKQTLLGKNTPIILHSDGSGDDVLATALEQSGCNAFLESPLSDQQLLDACRQLLPGEQASPTSDSVLNQAELVQAIEQFDTLSRREDDATQAASEDTIPLDDFTDLAMEIDGDAEPAAAPESAQPPVPEPDAVDADLAALAEEAVKRLGQLGAPDTEPASFNRDIAPEDWPRSEPTAVEIVEEVPTAEETPAEEPSSPLTEGAALAEVTGEDIEEHLTKLFGAESSAVEEGPPPPAAAPPPAATETSPETVQPDEAGLVGLEPEELVWEEGGEETAEPTPEQAHVVAAVEVEIEDRLEPAPVEAEPEPEIVAPTTGGKRSARRWLIPAAVVVVVAIGAALAFFFFAPGSGNSGAGLVAAPEAPLAEPGPDAAAGSTSGGSSSENTGAQTAGIIRLGTADTNAGPDDSVAEAPEPEPVIELAAADSEPDAELPVESVVPEDDAAPIEAPAVDFQPPRTLHRPEPDYSRDDVNPGQMEMVVLKVLVNEEGRPIKVEVDHGRPGSQLVSAAIEATLRTLYEPATEGGRPVAAWTREAYLFEP